MKPVIFVGMRPESIPEEERGELESLATRGGCELVVSHDPGRFAEMRDRIIAAAGAVPRDEIASMPRLKWFQQFGTGCDWLMNAPAVRSCDLVITNMSDNHYNALAEHVWALVLGLRRKLQLAVREQQHRRWYRPQGDAVRELRDEVILLAGVGSIGQRVAEFAKAFGMTTYGFSRHPGRTVPGIDYSFGIDDLREALELADVVVNTLPMTQETKHFFDAARFRQMRESAIFINVGRGGTVCEADLVDALRDGTIAGAGLDVFETEPLPEDSPLWELSNVILTGHYAGSSDSMLDRRMEVLCDNLTRFVEGRPLRNVVDKGAGY